MKIKVSEASGPVLDWLVAKCDLASLDHLRRNADKLQIKNMDMLIDYSPSTDWAQGGPIIEREKIATKWTGDKYGWSARWPKWVAVDNGETIPTEGGPTMLIAAMRCYVASKLGDEVDVPEELL